MPSVGQTKELSAKNCKQIKEELSTDCGTLPQSGVYWVLGQKVYTYVVASYIIICIGSFIFSQLLCAYRFIVT